VTAPEIDRDENGVFIRYVDDHGFFVIFRPTDREMELLQIMYQHIGSLSDPQAAG